ncbi:MAG TPA: hypothetical protein VFH02_08600 [Jiangellaceae bacterium]|nr:hypothetical protein [Jiangellaceae bacterium]
MSTSPDDERDLADIAVELYAVKPDEFIAARDEHVRRARESGRASLAEAVAALRRPNQSAWLINQLARDQADAVDELFDLGDSLRAAHQHGDGAELQRISAERRKAEAALIRRARALGAQAGIDVTADMARETEETLAAALASPEVAEEVRAGRLTKPVAYSGFGTMLTSVPAPSAPKKKRPAAKRDTAADTEAQRRAKAEQVVNDAREELEATELDLAERENAAEEAARRAEELGSQVDQLREHLRAVEGEQVASDRGARMEERRRDRARKSRDEARRALDQAERTLRSLRS